ncbi:hypothetical protein DFH28DRAFT_930177 [Melampsora americana]|nr:hypothetical protein DFH28DRAFT_930177 [Melampsora americana]
MRRGQTQAGANITHAEKRHMMAKDIVGPNEAQSESQSRAQVNPRSGQRETRSVTYMRGPNRTEKQKGHMGQGQAGPKNKQGRGANNGGAENTFGQRTSRENLYTRQLRTKEAQGKSWAQRHAAAKNTGDAVVCATRRAQEHAGPKNTQVIQSCVEHVGGPTQGVGVTVVTRAQGITCWNATQDPMARGAQDNSGYSVVCVTDMS